VLSVCVDSNGIKWFGTDKGLSSFDGVKWSTYTTEEKLADSTINKIVFEQTSYGPEIWLATNNGVSVMGITPDAVTCATPYRKGNTGLVSDTIYAAAVDTGHVKWFGTDSGVSTFDGDNWETYTVSDYLSNNIILDIGTAQDGWNFLGTKGGGVSRIRSDGIDAVTAASPSDTKWSGIVSDSVYAVYIDSRGVQWFGTDKGVSMHIGDKTKENWITYTTEDGLVNNFVLSITEDKNGVKWFGTLGGVSSFDGTNWKTYTAEDNLAGNIVYDIAVDMDGSLWFATNGGVSHYSGNATSVGTVSSKVFSYYVTARVYPNPFNMETTIEFSLPVKSSIAVVIYNIMGQRVRELLKTVLPRGMNIKG